MDIPIFSLVNTSCKKIQSCLIVLLNLLHSKIVSDQIHWCHELFIILLHCGILQVFNDNNWE